MDIPCAWERLELEVSWEPTHKTLHWHSCPEFSISPRKHHCWACGQGFWDEASLIVGLSQ